MDITQRKITKIAREVSKFTVRTLKEEGIGSSELDFLHVVRKNPGINQAEVCRILGIDKAAAARQARSLEKKGMLIRTQDPKDARARLLYAATKADQLKKSKADIERSFYDWLCEDLTSTEAQAFTLVLDKLYHKCKEESKAGFPHMTERIKYEKEKE